MVLTAGSPQCAGAGRQSAISPMPKLEIRRSPSSSAIDHRGGRRRGGDHGRRPDRRSAAREVAHEIPVPVLTGFLCRAARGDADRFAPAKASKGSQARPRQAGPKARRQNWHAISNGATDLTRPRSGRTAMAKPRRILTTHAGSSALPAGLVDVHRPSAPPPVPLQTATSKMPICEYLNGIYATLDRYPQLVRYKAFFLRRHGWLLAKYTVKPQVDLSTFPNSRDERPVFRG